MQGLTPDTTHRNNQESPSMHHNVSSKSPRPFVFRANFRWLKHYFHCRSLPTSCAKTMATFVLTFATMARVDNHILRKHCNESCETKSQRTTTSQPIIPPPSKNSKKKSRKPPSHPPLHYHPHIPHGKPLSPPLLNVTNLGTSVDEFRLCQRGPLGADGSSFIHVAWELKHRLLVIQAMTFWRMVKT